MKKLLNRKRIIIFAALLLLLAVIGYKFIFISSDEGILPIYSSAYFKLERKCSSPLPDEIKVSNEYYYKKLFATEYSVADVGGGLAALCNYCISEESDEDYAADIICTDYSGNVVRRYKKGYGYWLSVSIDDYVINGKEKKIIDFESYYKHYYYMMNGYGNHIGKRLYDPFMEYVFSSDKGLFRAANDYYEFSDDYNFITGNSDYHNFTITDKINNRDIYIDKVNECAFGNNSAVFVRENRNSAGHSSGCIYKKDDVCKILDFDFVPDDIICIDRESDLFGLCIENKVTIADLSDATPVFFETDLRAFYMGDYDKRTVDFSMKKLADDLLLYDYYSDKYSFLKINNGEIETIPFDKSEIKGGNITDVNFYGDIMEIETENGDKPVATLYQLTKR